MSHVLKAYYDANRILLSLKEEFPLTITQTLIGVALYNPDRMGRELTLDDLAFRLGIAPTTLSTHMGYLGDRYRATRLGLGLVQTREHSDSERAKSFSLSPAGETLVRQLEAALRRR